MLPSPWAVSFNTLRNLFAFFSRSGRLYPSLARSLPPSAPLSLSSSSDFVLHLVCHHALFLSLCTFSSIHPPLGTCLIHRQTFLLLLSTSILLRLSLSTLPFFGCRTPVNHTSSTYEVWLQTSQPSWLFSNLFTSFENKAQPFQVATRPSAGYHDTFFDVPMADEVEYSCVSRQVRQPTLSPPGQSGHLDSMVFCNGLVTQHPNTRHGRTELHARDTGRDSAAGMRRWGLVAAGSHDVSP